MARYYSASGKYKRIFELDFIRGICIFLVLFDHLMYNFAIANIGLNFFQSIKPTAVWYWTWNVRIYVRYIVVGLFFAVSGASSSFSKNNLKRGVKIFAIAMGITVVTKIYAYIVNNAGYVIDCGAIHIFALCILIFALISNWKIPVLVAISAVAIFLSWYIPSLGVVTTSKMFLIIGIKPVGYVYGDYLSLFPWLGYFILGGVFGKVFYKERKSLLGEVAPKLSKPILHVGRKSLFYYFGEMIILMPVFYLLGMIF